METSEFCRFCGLTLRCTHTASVESDTLRAAFAVPPSPPDLMLRCVCAHALPEPDGAPLAVQGALRTYRRGTHITLLRGQGAGLPPYAQTQYDLTQPCTGTTTVIGNAWSWATDARYFWHTQALPQLLLPFSCVLLHASVIEYAGGAVLFSAPSGTGKSTQAALWARHRGAHIRNGDKAGVRVLPDGVRAYGVPFAGTSGICERFSLPLRAVVLLRQSPVNTVTRLYGVRAATALLPNVFLSTAVPEEHQRLLELAFALAAAVPVLSLGCTPDVRAVETLEAALAESE